jgi:hypothetical protein
VTGKLVPEPIRDYATSHHDDEDPEAGA